MENCNKLLCLSVVLQLILIATSSPIDDLNFENIHKFMSKNKDSPSIDRHPLKVHNSDHDYTSICWAESLILTENKITKNQTMSKSYSVLLDAPEKLEQLHTESENASCIEILEHNAKPKKALNFTILKETDEYVIKEHKTLFCGEGPVLSQHFIVWPKLNRRQIEISINPLSSTKWKDCNTIDIQNDEESFTTEKTFVKSKKPSSKRQSKNDKKLDPVLTKQIQPSQNDNGLDDDFYSQEDDLTVGTGAMHGGFQQKQIIGLNSAKQAKNMLLRRDINCTIDGLGICNKMIEKSNHILGYKNSSQVVLGKWFFLDNSNISLDRERSFMLKVKIIINMENSFSNDDDDDVDNDRTELVLEEDCFYVIPKKKRNF